MTILELLILKITEKEIAKMDAFSRIIQHRTFHSSNHYVFYKLNNTGYGILFIGDKKMWVLQHEGTLYNVDLTFEIDRFPDHAKNVVLFNIDLFR